jgi:hypothetical protein
VVADAVLELVDAFLVDTKSQSLIDADRVRDFLLDLRLLLREDTCPN